MKLDMVNSWSVRIDVNAQSPSGRTYKRHCSLLVLASTAERAIELTRKHYPDSSVWAVNHANPNAIILYDEENRAPEAS